MDLSRFAREFLYDVPGEDCVHIFGLEVRGNRPRALMESALPPLNTTSAFQWPGPKAGSEEADLPSYAITEFTPAISRNSFSSGGSVRLIMSQKRPDDAGILVGYHHYEKGAFLLSEWPVSS